MIHAAAHEVMHVLERVPPESGALVRERTDGTMAGALLVEHGRVCWAMSERYPRRLTDILVAEQDTLSLAELAVVVAQCAREHKPFGETLLARGLVSLPVLHRALLRHTCEALDYLVRDEASPWAWIAHAGYGYHPMLTFSPTELITGVRAIGNPQLAARAQARLREVVRDDDQLGFAMERVAGARLPLAQVGCEGIDLGALAELARHAYDVTHAAGAVDAALALTELDGFACASWTERNVLYVLLCDGELAFNRLLAQAAALSIQP